MLAPASIPVAAGKKTANAAKKQPIPSPDAQLRSPDSGRKMGTKFVVNVSPAIQRECVSIHCRECVLTAVPGEPSLPLLRVRTTVQEGTNDKVSDGHEENN